MPLHYVIPVRKVGLYSQERQEYVSGRKQLPAKHQEGVKLLSQQGIVRWFNDRLRAILVLAELPMPLLEEIRLRVNQPLLLRFTTQDVFLNNQGKKVPPSQAYRVTTEDLSETLERLTQSSIYAAEEEIRQGFLTLPGGHRVGVCGEAVLQNGRVQTLKHVTGLNFRVAKEVSGFASELLPYLIKPDGRLAHTLILSAPRAGKTTLLRSLIRILSDGFPALDFRGKTVGVVDERGELAGMWQGVPAFNLGVRTDVLDGCPKAVGMGMLIRAMAPEILAVDELGREEDVGAIAEALRSGVSVLSTAHASSLAEARARPVLQQLFAEGIFERVIVLSRRDGPGTVEGVIDLGNGENLLKPDF